MEEEFTKRLLTPFNESKLILLLRQRFDVDLLLRLMAQEVRLLENGRELSFPNSPADRAGYETFRRVVLHLSAIQDHNQLFSEPLLVTRSWTIPAASVTAEGFQALEKEYLVTYHPEDQSYTLRKQATGRIRMTNYDPNTLPAEERTRLSEETEEQHADDVSFDIRPGYFGGEYPMRGYFRLRSFNAMLQFLARAMQEEPEFHVDKDARTPEVAENPVHTMEMIRSSERPPADLAIRSHGQYYAINTHAPFVRWNQDAFQLLYLLFQMTVSEVPRVGIPSITIAK